MTTKLENLIEQEYKRVQLIRNIKSLIQEQSNRQSWQEYGAKYPEAQIY